MSVDMTLGSVWPYFMQGHSYDIRPRYVLYGGLLFQPMSLDLLEAYRISDLRVRHFFDFFVTEQIYRQHPEVIILTNILPDPINTYLHALPITASWTRSTGKKIGTLAGSGPGLRATGRSFCREDGWGRSAARARPETGGRSP